MQHLGKNIVIVLSLVAAGFLAAWLRFRPYLGTEGQFTDGARTYDVSDPDEVRYAVWDSPELLPGEVNTDEDERRPAVSPDGRHLVFAAGERGLGADLWVADLVDGVAVDARPLTVLNTGSDEWAPCFSGSDLYFASDRLGSEGGLDLWRAEYDRGDFGPAVRLSGAINTNADETDPAPVPGSDSIAFSSNRLQTGERRASYDLYLARRAPVADVEEGKPEWEVRPLEELNTNFDEREPAFTADASTIFFASDRGGEEGVLDFDLYRSARDLENTEGWMPPEELAGINTDRSERAPLPARDGFHLTFAVEDAQGWALWRARSIELFRTPGRPVGWLELLILAALLLLALLARLSKEWAGLEVLYKCLLVSLIVHLLLMWWFQNVHPETDEYELKESGDRIRIHLISDRSQTIAAPVRKNNETAPRATTEPTASGQRRCLRAW